VKQMTGVFDENEHALPTSATADNGRMGNIMVMAMRVSTPWRDAGEFVAAFSRYCSEESCFVPTRAPRKAGVETAFSIRLADGTPMLRGLCVVLESWSDEHSPFGRAGVNLGIRKLSPHSADVLRRMLEAKPTVEMAPLFAQTNEAPCEVDEGEDDVADLTVPTRAPIMTLLGVAPVAAPPRRAWWMRWLDRTRRWFAPKLPARPRLARVALPALRLPDRRN
jgi:hypothetical protein